MVGTSGAQFRPTSLSPKGGDPSEAQGKSTRVSRAWVPPWVLESRSDRPSRRVSRPAALSEAERDRDLVSVSAKRRWSCESWTRPRMNRHSNPGLGRRSFHSRHRALGCVRAAPSVLKTTSQSLDRQIASMRTAPQTARQISCRTELAGSLFHVARQSKIDGALGATDGWL